MEFYRRYEREFLSDIREQAGIISYSILSIGQTSIRDIPATDVMHKLTRLLKKLLTFYAKAVYYETPNYGDEGNVIGYE
jgi:hypothetical protein